MPGPSPSPYQPTPEPVAVGRLGAHPRMQALIDQAVLGLEQELLDEHALPVPGHPAAHVLSPFLGFACRAQATPPAGRMPSGPRSRADGRVSEHPAGMGAAALQRPRAASSRRRSCAPRTATEVRWRSRAHRKRQPIETRRPARANVSGGARDKRSWWMSVLFAVGSHVLPGGRARRAVGEHAAGRHRSDVLRRLDLLHLGRLPAVLRGRQRRAHARAGRRAPAMETRLMGTAPDRLGRRPPCSSSGPCSSTSAPSRP